MRKLKIEDENLILWFNDFSGEWEINSEDKSLFVAKCIEDPDEERLAKMVRCWKKLRVKFKLSIFDYRYIDEEVIQFDE